MSRILILGAASSIGQLVARGLVTPGGKVFLTARNIDKLNGVAADLRVRFDVTVEIEQLDITDARALDNLISRTAESLDGLDTVIVVAGLLPDQDKVNQDTQRLRETMEVNATSTMVILNEAAAFFEQQGHGQIVAIGSVAGDRGRATNYAYGAAKGALEIFLSGLRQRLHKSGVKVLLVKPGFVDTPMTAAFKKGLLWASPERVAKDIVRAMEKGKSVIYTPWWWRWIMLVIRLIPEPIFVRLRF